MAWLLRRIVDLFNALARLARFPHAGDPILLGAWTGERGGPQDSPFIAGPYLEPLSAGEIGNAEEMYGRLVEVYGLG
jgi:hypothetical protein